MTVTFTASFTPRPDAGPRVEAILRGMVGSSRREPGCRTYDLYATETGFMLLERYVDEAALAAHRAAPYFVQYRRHIADLLAQPIAIVSLSPLDLASTDEVFGLAGG